MNCRRSYRFGNLNFMTKYVEHDYIRSIHRWIKEEGIPCFFKKNGDTTLFLPLFLRFPGSIHDR